MRIRLVWSGQESTEALASTADRTCWASAHGNSFRTMMGSHSSYTRPGRCWRCSSVTIQIHMGHTNLVDVWRCFSEVMPEEQCVLCPVRGSEKHWLAQWLQPDQLCQQEHVPMSSAVTQHRSTALSEDWLNERCILVMTEGLASTQGQVPSFRHCPRAAKASGSPVPQGPGAPRCGAG